MADIARMAGVSASTVSRALSGSPLIPEATRQRITELARSLNYQINVGAANLRKRDTRTVGVVLLGESLQAISDPFILSILGAVGDRLDELDMSLLLSRLKHGQPQQLAQRYDSGQVLGLIVIGQTGWHDELNRLAARGVPMAVWGACLSDALYPVVGGDNEQGGYLAASHLIRRGCQRIAFFGDREHPEVALRHQGYQRALAEAGLTADAALYLPYRFGDEGIRATVDAWLDGKPEFDAVFAASDVAAMATTAVLGDRGLRVPQQVKVVGYDDIALAGHLRPSLSSVRQPAREAGRALVDLLMEAADGSKHRTVMLPAVLVERESSR